MKIYHCEIVSHYAHIVNVEQTTMWQGRSLLQPQVSTDEKLGSRDRGGMLHVG